MRLDLHSEHPPAPGGDPFTTLRVFGIFLMRHLGNEGLLDEATARRRLIEWGAALDVR